MATPPGNPDTLAFADPAKDAAQIRLQLPNSDLSHLVMVRRSDGLNRVQSPCKNPIRNVTICLLADTFPLTADPLEWLTAVRASVRSLWTNAAPERTMPPVDIAARFGQNLRRCRKRVDLSQEELSVRASLHRTEISHLERGLRVARVDTLVKLRGSLGVSADELLDGMGWDPGGTRIGEFLAEGPDTETAGAQAALVSPTKPA